MPGDRRAIVIIRLKSKEFDDNFESLIERIRATGVDVITVEADQLSFPNVLTIDQALNIIKHLGEDLKKRLN